MKLAQKMKWSKPPDKLALDLGEAHIWYVDLDALSRRYSELTHILSSDERGRADKFRFPVDQRQFIASRCALRIFIGKYLGIEPAEVEFQFGEFGKPAQKNDRSLVFNISHSKGAGIFAFAEEFDLGVDIEFCKKKLEILDIANRFFSKNEIASLCRLPAEQRLQGFYNCWTRKEAFIKAAGKGLSFPLDEFEVSLDPTKPVEVLAIHTNPDDVANWSLFSFSPAENYAGAVAINGRVGKLGTFQATPRYLLAD